MFLCLLKKDVYKGMNGAGKTTFTNWLMGSITSENPSGKCGCYTEDFTVSSNDSNKITLIDGPFIECKKNCFFEMSEKNKEWLDKIKFRGIIVILKYNTRYFQTMGDFIFSLIKLGEDLYDYYAKKALIVVTHMDTAGGVNSKKSREDIEREILQEYTNKYGDGIVFFSTKDSMDKKIELFTKIKEHFYEMEYVPKHPCKEIDLHPKGLSPEESAAVWYRAFGALEKDQEYQRGINRGEEIGYQNGIKSNSIYKEAFENGYNKGQEEMQQKMFTETERIFGEQEEKYIKELEDNKKEIESLRQENARLKNESTK